MTEIERRQMTGGLALALIAVIGLAVLFGGCAWKSATLRSVSIGTEIVAGARKAISGEGKASICAHAISTCTTKPCAALERCKKARRTAIALFETTLLAMAGATRAVLAADKGDAASWIAQGLKAAGELCVAIGLWREPPSACSFLAGGAK